MTLNHEDTKATKFCQRCLEFKPLERFRICRYTNDGHANKCRDCVKQPPRFWGVYLSIINAHLAERYLNVPDFAQFRDRVWLKSGRPSMWTSGTHIYRPPHFKATRASGRRMACKLLDLKEGTVLFNSLDIREAAHVALQTYPELEEARAEWVAWRAAHRTDIVPPASAPAPFRCA